jgi:two-component system, response regulator PdtaR
MGFSTETPTVLVVNDEPLIRMDIEATIENADFRIYEAANADDAVALLEKCEDIEVVLTDVDMPGSMNGIELAHYAQAQRPLKIIFSSGQRYVAGTNLPPGAVFLAKPMQRSRLLDNLNTTSGKRRAAQAG